VSEEHSTGAAEAYRALRTNVLSALEKAGQNLLLVTSAESQEGKTLTVLNLALMSARTGRKVLLLDMDLRRGVLHKSLDMERSPGITDVLTEGRPLRDVIVKTSYDNLWFAPAGTTVKNTAELLQSVDLRAFLAEARQEFGLVLMDSAPVLRVTDTVILADPQLCAVVYVAHANKTPKPMIRYSIEMLEDANVIGMIVNSLEMHRISSLYYAYQYPNYAYYSYAYAYGYDYYYLDDGTRPKRLRAYYHAWAARRRAFGRWLRRTFLPME
jgi:capsular exopolysaccharide synthesis family protein